MRSQSDVQLAIHNLKDSIVAMDDVGCPSEQKAADAHHFPKAVAELAAFEWVLNGEQPVQFLHHVATVDGLTNCDFVMLHEQAIVASCRVEQWALPGGWITWVHVPEVYRRRGFATLLLDHVLQAAQAAGKEGLTLTVQAVNLPAQALYRQLGFRACGVPFYDLGNILMTHHFAPLVQKGEPGNA